MIGRSTFSGVPFGLESGTPSSSSRRLVDGGERPGEGHGGGLVTGQEQRHDLVPNLPVGEIRLIAQQIKQGRAIGRGAGPASADEFVDDVFELGPGPAQPAGHRQRGPQQHRTPRDQGQSEASEQVGQRAPDPRLQLPEIGAEQRGPDAVQGQARHLGNQIDLPAVGPPVGSSAGRAGEGLGVAGDPLRVERRLEGAAVTQMVLTRTGEQAVAEQSPGPHDPAALAGPARVPGQQLPDLAWVIDQQHPLRTHPQRNRVGATREQEVEELDRRAAERSHERQVDPGRMRRPGHHVVRQSKRHSKQLRR